MQGVCPKKLALVNSDCYQRLFRVNGAVGKACFSRTCAIARVVWAAPGTPFVVLACPVRRARGTPGFSQPAAPCGMCELATRVQSPRTRRLTGVPRAVFEACSATTPEDRRPGEGRPLLSSAGDLRPAGRIVAAWASARGMYVFHPPHGHRIPLRICDARDAPSPGRDGQEFNPRLRRE